MGSFSINECKPDFSYNKSALSQINLRSSKEVGFNKDPMRTIVLITLFDLFSRIHRPSFTLFEPWTNRIEDSSGSWMMHFHSSYFLALHLWIHSTIFASLGLILQIQKKQVWQLFIMTLCNMLHFVQYTIVMQNLLSLN